MRLLHVGIVVGEFEGIADAKRLYKALGYEEVFRVFRDEAWIGEIVGYPGAAIDIAHLKRANDPVGIELLAYRGAGPRLGLHHLCFEVDSIEHEHPRGAAKLGEAVIPDGPNRGTRCAYYLAETNVIEFVEKPKA